MTGEFEYDIAISFAGEQRRYAKQIAEYIRDVGRCTVFFDEFERAALWGTNLSDHFAEVYERKARFCVMLVSKEYAAKVWTTVERRSAQARAIAQKEEYILPIRFDETQVPGLPGTVGYIEADKTSPSEVCRLLLAKLKPDMPPPAVRKRGRSYTLGRGISIGTVAAVVLLALVLLAGFFARNARSPVVVSFDARSDLGRAPHQPPPSRAVVHQDVSTVVRRTAAPDSDTSKLRADLSSDTGQAIVQPLQNAPVETLQQVAASVAPRRDIDVEIVGHCGHEPFSQQLVRSSVLANIEHRGFPPVIVKIVGGTEGEVSEGSGTDVRAYGHYTICRGQNPTSCPDPAPQCDTYCRFTAGGSLTANRSLAADQLAGELSRRITSTELSSSNTLEGSLCGSQ